MAGVNKAIIVGNLGRDPEVRRTQGGKAVCNLAVATTYKPSGGEEETEWHRVTVWGKDAEFAGKFLAKGRQVYVEGRLQTRSYEKDGVTKYATEIVAHTLQALGLKPKGDGFVETVTRARDNAYDRPQSSMGDEIPF